MLQWTRREIRCWKNRCRGSYHCQRTSCPQCPQKVFPSSGLAAIFARGMRGPRRRDDHVEGTTTSRGRGACGDDHVGGDHVRGMRGRPRRGDGHVGTCGACGGGHVGHVEGTATCGTATSRGRPRAGHAGVRGRPRRGDDHVRGMRGPRRGDDHVLVP